VAASAQTALRYRQWWWTLGFVVAAVTLLLSVLPGDKLPTQGFNDKINHMIAYVALTVWFCGLTTRSRWWAVIVWLVAFGVFVEIIQSVTPFGRTGDPLDLVANSAGIALGLLAAYAGLARWPIWVEQILSRVARK
jgi:VanZ family protein